MHEDYVNIANKYRRIQTSHNMKPGSTSTLFCESLVVADGGEDEKELCHPGRSKSVHFHPFRVAEYKLKTFLKRDNNVMLLQNLSGVICHHKESWLCS